MAAQASLDACLLIGGHHEVLGPQGLVCPAALIEVEDAAGFMGELGITREDPAAVAPGSDGIAIEPPPQGCSADFRHQTAFDDLAADLGHGEARERLAGKLGQFAGKGLNFDDDAGGKSAPGRRHECALRVRKGAPRGNAYATC